MRDQPPPFAVRTAGLIRDQPFHSTQGSRQGDVMLTVFLGGRGSYRSPAGDAEITSGMVGLVACERPGILMADPRDPYVHFYCRFGGGYALALAQALVERAGRRFFPCPAAGALAEPIRRMGRIHRDELPDRMGRPELLLAEALVVLAGDAETGSPAAALSLGSLQDQLHAIVDQPTVLDTIACHFGVSRATLCRKARQFTGSTVQTLHERIKMQWAATLLDSTTLPIHQVARRVGYRDAFYFSRVFRRHHGRSPSAWRGGAEPRQSP